MCDMYSIENKSEESRAIQNNAEKHVPTAQFKDNRSQNVTEKGMTAQLEKKENLTGMPDNLKEGIESLSGFSMDDVRVHYNSSKPATVQALAYTQGTDIHVAPSQEKHLPHEAWHVAQQMAGRVSPTTNINGMPVNDNAELEREADVMGEKAVTQRKIPYSIREYGNFQNTVQCWNPKNCSIIYDQVYRDMEEDSKAMKKRYKDKVYMVDSCAYDKIASEKLQQAEKVVLVAHGKKGEFMGLPIGSLALQFANIWYPDGFFGEIFLNGCETGKPALSKSAALGDGTSYIENFGDELKKLYEQKGVHFSFEVKGNIGNVSTTRSGENEGRDTVERNEFFAQHEKNKGFSGLMRRIFGKQKGTVKYGFDSSDWDDFDDAQIVDVTGSHTE